MLGIMLRVFFHVSLPLVLTGCWLYDDYKWERKCEDLVNGLSKNYATDLTYTPPRHNRVEEPFYLLNFYGLNIPIPSIKYKHILVLYDEMGLPSLKLISSENEIIKVSYDHENLANPFERSQANLLRSLVHEKWRAEEHDEQPHPLALKDQLFRISSETVNCQANKGIERDLAHMSILGLVTKDIFSSLQSVHELPNEPNGLLQIYKGSRSGYTASVSVASKHENKPRTIDIFYSGSRNSSSLYAGVTFSDHSASNPIWVDALNNAIAKNTTHDWKNYFKHAEQTGISQKSIIESSCSIFSQIHLVTFEQDTMECAHDSPEHGDWIRD